LQRWHFLILALGLPGHAHHASAVATPSFNSRRSNRRHQRRTDGNTTPAGPVLGAGAAPSARPAVVAAAQPITNVSTEPVRLMQGTRLVALGVVLRADGRVLTSMRLDGPDKLASDEVTIVYPDNARVAGRALHHDKSNGLALVVPTEGRRVAGVIASELPPLASTARWFDGRKPMNVTMRMPSQAEFLAAGAEGWPQGVFIATGIETSSNGAAILDDAGNMLGIRTTRCSLVADPKTAGGIDTRCTFPAVATVMSIRNFLSRAPRTAVQAPAWLGISGQPNDGPVVRGVRVIATAPASPAATAGLHGDADLAKADIVSTVDGMPVQTPEALAELIAARAPGDRVKLLVFTGMKSREVTVILRAAP
jgi:hypothetical protein